LVAIPLLRRIVGKFNFAHAGGMIGGIIFASVKSAVIIFRHLCEKM